MRARVHLICAALAVALAAAAAVQEGHPLSGTWSGEWTRGGDARSRITIVMNWDGKEITGTINPGPDAADLRRVTVDYEKWTVRIEAERRDASGKPLPIVADGTLDDLGSWHRTLMGTWTEGGAKGSFKVTRD